MCPSSVSYFKNLYWGYSPGGQLIKTSPSNTGDEGSIPGWEAKIPHVWGPKKKKQPTKTKQKQYWNEFNKDLKNSPHQKIFLRIYIKGFYFMVLPAQNSRLES